MKNRATSYLTPMAAKTMTNGSSEVRIFAWRTICAASRLCGRPLPEKIGSFCPRTSVFMPSMQEIPVWMKSRGYVRASGLMGTPLTSRRSELHGRGVPVDGLAQAVEDAAEHVAGDPHFQRACPVNSTADVSVERPVLVPKICTATAASEISMIRPARSAAGAVVDPDQLAEPDVLGAVRG